MPTTDRWSTGMASSPATNRSLPRREPASPRRWSLSGSLDDAKVTVIVDRGDDSEARGLRLKSENELTRRRERLPVEPVVLGAGVARSRRRKPTHDRRKERIQGADASGRGVAGLEFAGNRAGILRTRFENGGSIIRRQPEWTYLVARARLGVGDCLWRLKKGTGQSEIGRAVSELESLEDAGLPPRCGLPTSRHLHERWLLNPGDTVRRHPC